LQDVQQGKHLTKKDYLRPYIVALTDVELQPDEAQKIAQIVQKIGP